MPRPVLLFAVEAIFSKRDYDRFGIGVLKKYFEVRVLDCTALVVPNFDRQFGHIAYRVEEYARVASLSDLTAAISSFREAHFIDFLGVSGEAFRVRHALIRRRFKRIVIRFGAMPKPKTTLFQRVCLFWERTNKLSAVVNKVSLVGKGAHYPIDVAVLSGLACRDKRLASANRIVHSHTFDYDIFLRLNGQAKGVQPYAVFLDQDLVHHSDYAHSGEGRVLDESEYYGDLDRFFSAFENQAGMKVIFAAHPRSNYDARPNVLFGRPVKVGATAELVRDASIVFAHFSTCIGFPVLWKKPIVFLKARHFDGRYFGAYVDKFAEELNAPIVDITQVSVSAVAVRWAAWFSIDSEKYARYVDLYLKYPGSPNVPFWEHLSDSILT